MPGCYDEPRGRLVYPCVYSMGTLQLSYTVVGLPWMAVVRMGYLDVAMKAMTGYDHH